MTRVLYESAATPTLHSATDPVKFNVVCRSKSHLPNRTDLNTALLPYVTQFWHMNGAVFGAGLSASMAWFQHIIYQTTSSPRSRSITKTLEMKTLTACLLPRQLNFNHLLSTMPPNPGTFFLITYAKISLISFKLKVKKTSISCQLTFTFMNPLYDLFCFVFISIIYYLFILFCTGLHLNQLCWTGISV